MDSDLKNWLSRICLHQGRTDQNYGHRDWLNRCGWGIGAYHYHHGLSAHLHPSGVCPYLKQAFIINPYTSKRISLGQPYIFQNEEYYSLNLVSKALTADDTTGVTLNHNNTGGGFYACSTGYSNTTGLGEDFTFVYPKILIILNNNTLFLTENEKLQLLCYTKKSAFDDIECYAYINLKTIGEYMTKDGYFTDLIDNGSGVWSFKLSNEASEFGVAITNPKNNELFTVGDNLIVTAAINKVANANLIIGAHNEFIDNLENQRKVLFSSRTFTNEDVGDLTLKVEAGNDLATDTATSSVQIQVKWPSITKQIEDIRRKKAEDINNYYRTLYGDSESVIYGTGIWESTLCGADIVKYVHQNGIIVEREKDYSLEMPIMGKLYGVDVFIQYSIYKDIVGDHMSYGDFMNICGPYWEEDWKVLFLKELYNWFNIFSIAVMGYVAISNVQISKININIPKINWGGMADTGYGTIYVAPSISMTTASAWAVDIAGVPSILLEQITFSMANNGISGSPTSGGGESTGNANIGNKLDYVFGKATGNIHNIERSQSMMNELKKIGIHDTPANRALLQSHLDDVVKNPNNILRTELRSYTVNGQTFEYTATIRESFFMGPGGGVKIESIWDGMRLLTTLIKGGS